MNRAFPFGCFFEKQQKQPFFSCGLEKSITFAEKSYQMKAVDVLTHRGFIGSVRFSAQDDVFFGKVEGVNDLITFEGDSVKELKDAFRYVVDEHIKDCEDENIPIEKSYKGSFNLRLTPELHRRAAITAKARGSTLNSFVREAIEKKLELA
jgi:predicted HicB family RNase H-like nuclease